MSGNKKNKRIPLFNLEISSHAKKEANEVLESGWLSGGNKVQKLEKDVASLLGMKYAAAVNSCTVGLQIVLSTIGAGKNKKVITSPFTFVGTIEAIMHAGADVIFADIDPKTLTIDIDEVARKITKNCIAILPVDIAGYPSDYTKLKKVSDQFSIPIISDSAHAIGGLYKNKSIPKFTDASVYSFYSTKNLTCGEGGMVVSEHKELIDALKILSRHGLTKSTFDRHKEKNWKYDVAHLGFKANLSELSAAVGLGQLKVFKKEQAKREKIANRYYKNLQNYNDLFELPIIEKNKTHGWHLFIIRLNLSELSISRNQFIEKMNKKNIECGVHYQPIFEFDFYKEALGYTGQYLPNAAYAGERVVSLPFYPSLLLKDVDYVCEQIIDILRKSKK
ncbi:MAG: DegT/DnrJ/EryC1/StrS family aminotransferase [candidate division Zixibacteria bacterium]|nr:DegT/DnrJ/EryC1/StrS family aminotransferase [candidate division Zixibacteria bacterium]